MGYQMTYAKVDKLIPMLQRLCDAAGGNWTGEPCTGTYLVTLRFDPVGSLEHFELEWKQHEEIANKMRRELGMDESAP